MHYYKEKDNDCGNLISNFHKLKIINQNFDGIASKKCLYILISYI